MESGPPRRPVPKNSLSRGGRGGGNEGKISFVSRFLPEFLNFSAFSYQGNRGEHTNGEHQIPEGSNSQSRKRYSLRPHWGHLGVDLAHLQVRYNGFGWTIHLLRVALRFFLQVYVFPRDFRGMGAACICNRCVSLIPRKKHRCGSKVLWRYTRTCCVRLLMNTRGASRGPNTQSIIVSSPLRSSSFVLPYRCLYRAFARLVGATSSPNSAVLRLVSSSQEKETRQETSVQKQHVDW